MAPSCRFVPALATIAAAQLALGDLRVANAEEPERIPFDELTIAHDGHKHFIAYRGPILISGKLSHGKLYFGDGKTFNDVPIGSTSEVVPGDRVLDTYGLFFNDARYHSGSDVALRVRPSNVVLTCRGESRAFFPVDSSTAAKIARSAKLERKRWLRTEAGLYRDDDGRYYYVDRHVDRQRPYDRRLFIGIRGQLKPTPLRNIVSDVAGELYVSKAGTLKVVYVGKNQLPEAYWLKGKTSRRLTTVNERARESVEQLIYGDLGVYLGQKFHTPCDWL